MGFAIIAIFSILLWLTEYRIEAIAVMFLCIGFFSLLILSGVIKDKAGIFIYIGFNSILIGFCFLSTIFVFDDKPGTRIVGTILVIVCVLFLIIINGFILYESNIRVPKDLEKKEKLNPCYRCDGTGMRTKVKVCSFCDGTGKDPRKSDIRSHICYYCGNTGKCNRCKGTKMQKKHLIFGPEVQCQKCNGLGICAICKDAPNSGYYMSFFINDQARSGPPDGTSSRLKETNEHIKKVTEKWENLGLKNKEILRFEEFASYPSHDEIEKLNKSSYYEDYRYRHLLCDIVDSELIRYEQYLEDLK